ncbi:YIP1 family protein [Deinococcus planocerae]|uniref:YIP1 family protein n=1 Tax=Deinococcus planocerae TaxID=1737569 RepID=UPI000C7E9C8D|nr:YIP1 family protein [Deinococcus planocerae]
MTAPSPIQAKITDMFSQSVTVLARPGPQTFELFERRGGISQAVIYVLLAAVVSALIAAIFAPFHAGTTFFGQLITRLVLIPLQFFIFTGAVYLIGKYVFRGTGTYPEVAYSFALFFVPLSIIGTLLGIIPILGFLVGLLISVAMIFYGFLAVGSSMNIHDAVKAGVTLILSGIAYWAVGGFLLALILAPFTRG